MGNTFLPALPSTGNSLAVYLNEIKKFPILTEDEEFILSKRFKDDGDIDAAHKLVTSHLRLAASIAMTFKNYGLPLADLISEANIGLMQAVKKFDPDKGYRLSTYAIWWIKAALHEFIIKSWSLVKIGTVANQKKLFYNLHKIKTKLGILDDRELTPDEANEIAGYLSVETDEVLDMSRRLRGDSSLNVKIGDEEKSERQDFLADKAPNQESVALARSEAKFKHNLILEGLSVLNDRERDILTSRKLIEEPLTLDELSVKYGISRERVRQIETKAFEKLSEKIKSLSSNPIF